MLPTSLWHTQYGRREVEEVHTIGKYGSISFPIAQWLARTPRLDGPYNPVPVCKDKSFIRQGPGTLTIIYHTVHNCNVLLCIFSEGEGPCPLLKEDLASQLTEHLLHTI